MNQSITSPDPEDLPIPSPPSSPCHPSISAAPPSSTPPPSPAALPSAAALAPVPQSTNILITNIENNFSLISSCSSAEPVTTLLSQFALQNNLSESFVSSQISIKTLSSKENLICSPYSDVAHPSFASLLEYFHSSSMSSATSSPTSMWTTNFLLNINTMLLYLRPAMTTLLQQKITLDHIAKTLYKCLGTIAFPTGVAITHATLPDDRIDMTVFLRNPVDPKWHIKFHEALLPDNPLDNPPPLTSLQFFHKDKSASLVYGDIHVNISINDIAALYNSAVYEDVDAVMSSDGLMKVSYLLIKSWIINDSGLPVSLYPRLLNGKVLQVMVFYLFCRYGHLVSHPFIALLFFLHLYSTFDFENTMIDLNIALDAYSEMITADPTLEMKYQYRAQSTAASVQSLLASCVGVETSPDTKPEAVPVTASISTDDHPKSKQHHPCPPHVMIDKIRFLLSESRSRYEATMLAYTRVVEDDPSSGHTAYGNYFEDPHSGGKVNPATKFKKGFMNVVDPICNHLNLSEHITKADVLLINSVFTTGLHKMVFNLEKLNSHYSCPPPAPQPQPLTEPNEEEDLPVTPKQPEPVNPPHSSDPFETFYFHCLGKTRQIAIRHKNKATTVHDLAFIEQLKKNPCYRDNAIVSPPDLLLKQGEFILMGIQNSTGQLQITPTAVANLIVQCLERYGPQLVGDIGKQLQDLTGIPNLPKILKAKYRGLKKVIEAFPTLFQIGTDHIINPTISLKEPRRPGPIEEPISNRLPDYSNPQQQGGNQFQHNRNQGQGQQVGNQYSQYPNNQRSNKYPNSNSRQNNNDNYYRSSMNSGYNRNMDRGMMHQQQVESDEYYDQDGRYYYDQYSGAGAGGGYGSNSGHNRSGQNYTNNYPTPREARNQQQYTHSRGGGGGGVQQQYSDYDYDPRWSQQEISRPRSSQSQRESYGADGNYYQSERTNTRDSRIPQSWAAFQESENPQRSAAPSFYPRSEPRDVLPHDMEDYRHDYEPNSLSQYHSRSSQQETPSSSGWLDIEGLIGLNENPDYTGLDSPLDLNFQM